MSKNVTDKILNAAAEKKMMKKISLYVPEGLYERFKRLCEARKVSINKTASALMQFFIDEQTKK